MPDAPELSAEVSGQDAGDLQRAAETISRNLSVLLCAVTGVARLASEVAGLRADVTALRTEAGSHAESLQALSGRLAGVEEALRAQEEKQTRLVEQLEQFFRAQQESQNGKIESQSVQLQSVAASLAELQERMAQIREEQQAHLKRLDSQAEALRALHQAAEEAAVRREELRDTVQKLGMLASAPAGIGPLPQDF
ncbi:MAG: hypothetical protein IT159_11825 [Bryobacterales bacterium]|nr:hypothetical protein [Bryobacterales bacterium]